MTAALATTDEADVAVGAGVVAVGDQRRAVQPPPGAQPDARRDLVAGEPDDARERQHPEVVDAARVDRGGRSPRRRRRTALMKIAATTK